MKNSEIFEKQLEELDQAPEAQAELARLRQHLRQTAGQEGPSAQEQAWAWTRLQARLREEQLEPAGFWLPYLQWAAYGAIGLFLISVFVRLQTVQLDGIEVASVQPLPPALVEPAVETPAPEQAQLPTVAMANPEVHAVSFHSQEAAADVIWATGYTYLPASFDPR